MNRLRLSVDRIARRIADALSRVSILDHLVVSRMSRDRLVRWSDRMIIVLPIRWFDPVSRSRLGGRRGRPRPSIGRVQNVPLRSEMPRLRLKRLD